MAYSERLGTPIETCNLHRPTDLKDGKIGKNVPSICLDSAAFETVVLGGESHAHHWFFRSEFTVLEV